MASPKEAVMTFWIVLGVILLALVALVLWRRHRRGSGLAGDHATERAGRASQANAAGRGFFAGY